VARKVVVRVILSKEQKEMLIALKTRLGTSESETLRLALMNYAKDVDMIKELMQEKSREEKENAEQKKTGTSESE
jgi:hypothetical protein